MKTICIFECLHRMHNEWLNPKFSLWMTNRHAHPHTQVQAVCKENSLIACGFNPDDDSQRNGCLEIQRMYPNIKLITLQYATHLCRTIGRNTPQCYVDKRFPMSRGFQLVDVVDKDDIELETHYLRSPVNNDDFFNNLM